MKPTTTLTLLLTTLRTTTHACITVHSYFPTYFVAPDHLELQVKDNGVEVCRGGQSIEFSSTDDEWCIDENSGCNAVYKVCVTDNGQSGYVENSLATEGPYHADLRMAPFSPPDQSQDNDFTCWMSGEHEIKCVEIESCLDDDYWNCDAVGYYLFCDYKAFC